jgi:tRNA-binding protein
MSQISWNDFDKVELRVGTILKADEFPEARNPAWKLTVDFGEETGVLCASAQITDLYESEELVGKQVLGVVNFPPKQIGPFMSECLVTGFVQANGSVVLAVPDQPVANGLRLK